ALVPRPETEQLVEFLQSEIHDAKSRILDVGTGTGVIALSLAAKFPEAEVIGSDISDEALSLARDNAARLGITRVQFVESNLMQNISGEFDLIVANLPYISTLDRDELAPDALRDPEVAPFA